MTPLRALVLLVGFAAVTWLLSRVPDDVFGWAQVTLLVVAGVVVLVVAAAVFLRPARLVLAQAFLTPRPSPGAAFALADATELRALALPVTIAMACLVAAGVAAALRG